jgi:hypothetical protein
MTNNIMPEKRVFRYEGIVGEKGEYILEQFDTLLHSTCPLDGTNIIQSQEHETVNFCPNCKTRYDSLKPEDMLKTILSRISNISREFREVREKEQRLVAIILAARVKGI